MNKHVREVLRRYVQYGGDEDVHKSAFREIERLEAIADAADKVFLELSNASILNRDNRGWDFAFKWQVIAALAAYRKVKGVE